MSNPISGPPPGSPPPSGGAPDASKFLDNVKVHPGDEKLLRTPFGMMIIKYAHGEDQTTLIKTVKKALEQYVQALTKEMTREMKRSEEAIKKLGKASRGESDE